jgi:hypothetical protein
MLGTKAWLLIAGVNRQWRDLYAAAVQLSREASARHVVASVAAYEYARHCGRDSTTDGEARLLGELAGVDVMYRYAEEAQVAATVAAAFKSGRADTLQLLHVLSSYLRPGLTCDTSLLCWAALLGQLECVCFLTTAVGAQQGSHHIRQSARSKVSCYAAKGGHVPLLQWLQQHGFLQEPAQPSQRFPSSLCGTAARHGGANAVVWLHKQGFKLGVKACAGAAEAGNLQQRSGCTASALPCQLAYGTSNAGRACVVDADAVALLILAHGSGLMSMAALATALRMTRRTSSSSSSTL